MSGLDPTSRRSYMKSCLKVFSGAFLTPCLCEADLNAAFTLNNRGGGGQSRHSSLGASERKPQLWPETLRQQGLFRHVAVTVGLAPRPAPVISVATVIYKYAHPHFHTH